MWKNIFNLATSLVGGASVQTYIYAGLILSSFSAGFYVEHLRFAQFQDEVKIVAEKQIAKNEEIKKEQVLINKGISNEYEAKLSAINSYYGGLHNSSSRQLSSISATTSLSDAKAEYTILAGQCAETTQQLVSLQEWINEQIGLK